MLQFHIDLLDENKYSKSAASFSIPLALEVEVKQVLYLILLVLLNNLDVLI